MDSVIRNDWLRQAAIKSKPKPMTVEDDAAGGCDGVKDGSAGFHTQKQQNPWWQVDLGSVAKLGRIVIWNKTADKFAQLRSKRLVVQLSAEGKAWEVIYRHDGAPFHGVAGGKPLGKPLTVQALGKKARYVRVGLAGTEFFHLDEVEVFAAENPKVNLALDRPATQSSICNWSTSHKKSLSKFQHATQDALKLAIATRTLMGGSDRIAAYNAAMVELGKKFDEATPETDFQELYFETRQLRREMILSHPTLAFYR
ncbi:MAG: discoidin domain-containing protein, partial [bacterium]|nr:discoidin domain-containing protein [bacterium]